MQIIFIVTAALILEGVVAPPVQKNKDPDPLENEISDGLEDYMEYHRYLREVVGALESDPDFRKKLANASESDIKTGKIADELEFVSHQVRTRLDEIKRTELERLRELAEQKFEMQEEKHDDHDQTKHHLDHMNPHTFEVEDLKKLIAKSTADLAVADQKRREEFKQYELQKEFEKELKINSTSGENREKLVHEYEERDEKHKKHEPLHQPGHKQQLEEVWEEQDHMEQEFDPKTFFMLHDLDGNGMWDQNEVKALFVKELDKMYASGAPEDDMRERYEEMERMRESVFMEVDADRDGVINYYEFLQQTKKKDFKEDNGWKSLDEQRPFTDEEYQEYLRQHEAERRAHGYYPAQVPPGYHGEAPYQQQPYYQQHPSGPAYQPNQGQAHPNQGMPPHPNQGMPHQNQGMHHPNQGMPHPNQGMPHPNQGMPHPNQGMPHPNQGIPPPNQGMPHPNQGIPPPNQVPPQGYHAPQGQQFHPGQQAQMHPQQLPGQVHPNKIPPQSNPSFGSTSNQDQHHLNTNEVLPEKTNQHPGSVERQPAAAQVNQGQQQAPLQNKQVPQQQVPAQVQGNHLPQNSIEKQAQRTKSSGEQQQQRLVQQGHNQHEQAKH